MSKFEAGQSTQTVNDVIKATLTPPGAASADGQFKSGEVSTYRLGNDHHFWALQGDPARVYDLILLMIPDNTADGDHPIVPEGGSGVRAIFVTSQGQGYAASGTVSGLKWGQGKQSVRADFSFHSTIAGKSYDIGSGRLEFTNGLTREQTASVTGSVLAQVQPPVFPNYGSFQSTGVSFRASGTGTYTLNAWQTIEGSEVQGILLHLATDNPGTPVRAFFTKNGWLYLTSDYSLANVSWDKDQRTFEGDFEFKFNSSVDREHAVSSGKIRLQY